MWVGRGASLLAHLTISIMNLSASGRFMLKSSGAEQITKTHQQPKPRVSAFTFSDLA